MSKYNPIDPDEERTYWARRNLRPPTIRQQLLKSMDEDDLLRTPNGQVWVSTQCDDNSWTFSPIRSAQYRDSIFGDFFQKRDCFPSPADWSHAVNCWQGAAQTVRYHPTLRIGGDGRQQILWDTEGGPDARSGCLQIRPDGWTDFDYGPGQFYRPASSSPFPNFNFDTTPVFHSLLPLRDLIHTATPADWHRIVIWLLSALRPKGPYPILVLQGPHASGKTAAARILRHLIDPAVSSFLPLPASESRLHAQAFDNYVLAFDHVAKMPCRFSDMLCRLSTGATAYIGGYPQELQRPIILTVPDYANWTPTPDLAGRLLVANLAEIPNDRQLLDSQMEERFRKQALSPAVKILCDAISRALKLQSAAGQESGRETWARSAAPILGLSEHDITEALQPARRESPLVPNLVGFLSTQPGQTWKGTATDLLEKLPESTRPRNDKDLGRRLSRLKPDLAAQGIELIRGRKSQARGIHLHLQNLMSSCHQAADACLLTPPDFPSDWPVSDAKRKVEVAEQPLPTPPVTIDSASQIPLSPCHLLPEPPPDDDCTLDPIHVILPNPDPATRRRDVLRSLQALKKKLGTLIEHDEPEDQPSEPDTPEPEPRYSDSCLLTPPDSSSPDTEWTIEYHDPADPAGGDDTS